MAKILKDDGAGKCYLAELPDYSGLIGADLFSKWAIVVHDAAWHGELIPRNPMVVYQEGVRKMLQALTEDPEKALDTQEILRSITSADDRQSIKAERENYRALQEAGYDPDAYEETHADKHEPNVLERQAIARRNLRVLFARLSAEEVADLQAWMQADCNFTDAAKLRGLPTQTYRDHMQKHFTKMLGMCKKLGMEGSLDEIL